MKYGWVSSISNLINRQQQWKRLSTMSLVFPGSPRTWRVTVVRDLKRSSVVIVPKTFRTPFTMPSVRGYSSTLCEEAEHGKRVGFDTSQNASREAGGKEAGRRTMSTPGFRIRNENLRDREKKERKGGKEAEKEVKREWKEGGKEQPPTSPPHGYKYPTQQPKSILKRTEASLGSEIQSCIPLQQ
jgi:hypothetical protein